MFDALVTDLKNIRDIPFQEYEWKTRPDSDYGTVQIDFEAAADNGDDSKQDRAFEGSLDMFTRGKKMTIVAKVETVLEKHCSGSWSLNSEQHEHETGFVHREYVFQLEKR